MSLRIVSAPASIRTSATFSLSAEVNKRLGGLETARMSAVEPFFKSENSVKRMVAEHHGASTELVLI